MTPKHDGFNCLTHGDAWLPNILFHYDSNSQLTDCQFIDFQQSVYTSPAVDLINLIFTSAETETKFQNFEFFVKFYHERLIKELKLLQYSKKVPTLKELYLDVLDRGFLAVWQGFAVLPPCLIENVEESSTDNLLGDDEEGKKYKEKLYNNDRYRKHMTELLTYFDDRGLVELS
jgi:Ecdysteroid kinase-like family